ncbi:unnamed protein product [Prorocentrum cordatum]|uniref:Reverse transcriptase domain-containing protein n=1 Tax=Prorocentrum cordatum TaxID=2364126 RepID=A0ABN9VEW5_9DINO|nr:unnamed protein product [Polarella glacialis]
MHPHLAGSSCGEGVLSVLALSDGLAAGNRLAPTMFRFCLPLCPDYLLQAFRLIACLYVDDIALRAVAWEAQALSMLPLAMRLFFWIVESFLGPEVPRSRVGVHGKYK